jgi:hypothetical protein
MATVTTTAAAATRILGQNWNFPGRYIHWIIQTLIFSPFYKGDMALYVDIEGNDSLGGGTATGGSVPITGDDTP